MPAQPMKLVITDLDGTLFDPQGYIPASALEAIAALKAAGIPFTIASGRGVQLMMPVVRRLELTVPVIISGGAIILHAPGGEVLDEQLMDMEDAAALLAYARANQLGVSFHERDRVCAEGPDLIWTRTAERNWLPEEPTRILPFSDCGDLMAGRTRPPARVDLFGPPERIKPAIAQLPNRFPHLQVMQVIGHLEITRAGVNKGSAVRRLAQHLGIPLESAMVVGDDVNDLSMFAVAGLAVAMGNAHPTVKFLAGAVAPDNSLDGFAWAVKRFALLSSET